MARARQNALDISVVAATIWLLLSLIGLLFLQNAPHPYMDEPFHVAQTQKYCEGKFQEWDPKITTFPGLYLIAAPVGLLTHHLSTLLRPNSLAKLCSTQTLRNVNCGFAAFVFILVFHIHRCIHRSSGADTALKVASLVLLIPTIFFYSFLYYTDMGALASVLMTLLASLKGRYMLAGFAGAVAVLFRQTNAVWVVFILVDAILRELSSNPILKQPNPKYGLSQQIVAAIKLSLRNWRLLLSRLWPLAIVPAMFAAFVVWNGGIVVGDRSNHTPSLHLMQPFYFALFASIILNQFYFSPSRVKEAHQHASSSLQRQPKNFIKTAGMFFVFSSYIIAKFTLVHPFLLADNRHYTFYVWKDIIAAYPAARFCLIPLYGYALWCIGDSLKSGGRLQIWILAFAMCTILALAPAWLIELRYFTVPLVLMVLFMEPPSSSQLVRSSILFSLVNAATIYVFLYRPFTWGDGTTARFMW